MKLFIRKYIRTGKPPLPPSPVSAIKHDYKNMLPLAWSQRFFSEVIVPAPLISLNSTSKQKFVVDAF